jgi:hypothetical protein
MKTVAKNASRRDSDDSSSVPTSTIEVKDVSDSEIEGNSRADQE